MDASRVRFCPDQAGGVGRKRLLPQQSRGYEGFCQTGTVGNLGK